MSEYIHTSSGKKPIPSPSDVLFKEVDKVRAEIARIEQDIARLESLKSSMTQYGLCMLSDRTDVTDSAGLALPASEKNASVSGTLANSIEKLKGFSAKAVTPNTQITGNAVGEFYGMAFRTGNTVTVYVKFSRAYFKSGEAICSVPNGFRPKADSVAVISTRRSAQKGVYFNTRCTVHTNGNIAQTFNSDGTGVEWEGTIFACYQTE